jgi:predicted RecB family nuclease
MEKAQETEEQDEPGLPHVSPSGLYNLLKPTYCDKREWLKSHDYDDEPVTAFRELLMRMGIEHEARHAKRFKNIVDISLLPKEEQEAATLDALNSESRPVIYQGRLSAVADLAGREVDITGHPDFLLPAREGWAIRDSKLNRSINEYIQLQLHGYAWLYSQNTLSEPVALQMHAGSGEIKDVELNQDSMDRMLELLGRMVELRFDDEPPQVHVSASRCGGCGFKQHCWPQAEKRREIGLIAGLDRGTVEKLHERGAHTVDELLEQVTEDKLAEMERWWGRRMQPIGTDGARRILAGARAFQTGEPILLKKPELPDHDNWVMFDLEGMPPRIDEVEKIYLWGLQVFGKQPGAFRPALAGFGPGGDREGWFAFLAECESLFAEHGDIPFVHWATYERVKIDMYVNRYGDPDGIAARVNANLLDLLPITRNAVAVPVSSYRLKEIETLTGYERKLEEYGGDWSMARYIEATETADREERERLMAGILDYNREDLKATWAVLQWLGHLRVLTG